VGGFLSFVFIGVYSRFADFPFLSLHALLFRRLFAFLPSRPANRGSVFLSKKLLHIGGIEVAEIETGVRRAL